LLEAEITTIQDLYLDGKKDEAAAVMASAPEDRANARSAAGQCCPNVRSIDRQEGKRCTR
jgi:hypothetical protein